MEDGKRRKMSSSFLYLEYVLYSKIVDKSTFNNYQTKE